jgi:predicted component of type VI protein secretion system
MALMLSIVAEGLQPGSVNSPVVLKDSGGVIGRAAACAVVLPDPSSWISSRHCSVERRGGAWELIDTSTNGTTVNGHRISVPHILAEGDVIGVGGYRLTVAMGKGGTAQMAATHADSRGSDAAGRLLAAAGVAPTAVTVSDAALLASAGGLLRQLTRGTAALAANRAKARYELGARGGAGTDADNMLLVAGAPEAILAKLLMAPPAEAGAQVAAALRAIDNHQRATLQAMQIALRATLDKLSPAAISRVAGGDDAARWRAYEAAFVGASSDTGFIELFARELGAAYERLENPSGAAKSG